MHTRVLVLVAAMTAGALAAAALAGDDGKKPAGDRFVVHEWGTFTSMQGSGGLALEGLTREEESLPDFVYDRTKIRDCPLRDQGWKGLEMPAERVTQKMETPVIYFHSATERRVRVRVDFMKGLISQWYPVTDTLGPPEGAAGAAPLDVSKLDRSFLEWDVDVLPKGSAAPREVPSVAETDPWAFARDVDASWVRTRPREGPDRAGPVEADRYLFYRGIGSFPLPLSARAGAGGTLTLVNSGAVAIPFAVAFEVKDGKGRIGSSLGSVPVRGESRADLSAEDWIPVEGMSKKLEMLVWDLLRKQALHDDEARAMVRTWARSWFRSEGMRVLWIVPRSTTDAILPLAVTPKPDSLVRVLVGRLEIIPPETEAEDHAALAAITQEKDTDAAARGMAVLARRGRFLEPHLRNVIGAIDVRAKAGTPRGDDAAVRARAAAWISKIAAGHASLPSEETPFAR